MSHSFQAVVNTKDYTRQSSCEAQVIATVFKITTTTPKLICSLNYFNLPLTICKFTLFKNQGILDSLCHPALSGRDPVLGHILFVVCPLGVKITVSQRIIAQIVLVEACWETGQCFARAEKLGLTFTQSLLFTSSESAVSTTAR